MQFDHLSYGDFNPHLLYIGKKVPEVSGEDHSHDYLELTYILSGQARYYIEGKEYLLQPGELLVGNPGLVHRFELREGEKTPIEVYNGFVFESRSKGYVVKRIIAYMNENYASHISLDQIAANMYLSPVYISKIFKEETGESPIRYLIKIRLEKAKEILEKENCGSVRNVSLAVGYEDVYYFSKLFKKYYGIAPVYYKRQAQKENGKELK